MTVRELVKQIIDNTEDLDYDVLFVDDNYETYLENIKIDNHKGLVAIVLNGKDS
jgi:hypothetical protein